MSSQPSTPARGGDLAVRIARVEQALPRDPAQAERLAAELLADAPDQPMAMLFQGIARRLLGDANGAVAVLEPLCGAWPAAPLPHLQLGLALRESGRNEGAETAMRRAVGIKPDFGDAWLSLGDLLRAMGKPGEADAAYVSYVRCSAADPDIAAAASALGENRPADAEPILRRRLQQHPTDVAAMCLLADAFARSGFPAEAELMLRDCLALAPGYRAARQNLAVVLLRQNRPAEALHECDRVLESAPADAGAQLLRANVLRRLGEFDECVRLYRGVLDADPAQPRAWTSLAHTLRTLGRTPECTEAFRRAIAVNPGYGEPYWAMSGMKPSPVTDADVSAMKSWLAKPDLDPEDRIHFNFALGLALETRASHAESFRHFTEANRLSRAAVRYDPDDMTRLVQRCRALFTQDFFAARTGCGAIAADPIFIVGLPRSGSTLVEQILASHSAVEATSELPDLPALARKIDAGTGAYPDALAELDATTLEALGEEYLARARLQRKTDRPFFIDKMPNNFAHTGLIHLILPQARIIDVRRHPLACGFSLYKLLFSHGQHFSYDLGDIGRYYLDYLELMKHFDRVLPGRVHRIIYEDLVRDTETSVRALLAHCGLPFEPACLAFHKTRRPVSTPSVEQVQSPIFGDGLDQWRHYEPWLGPLKDVLGDAVVSYRGTD